ncbi:MAG: copper chaperone PCu(A)C [Thermodesulfobacteriota bacterium]
MKGNKRIYAVGVALFVLFCAAFVEAHGDKADKAETITVSDAYIQEVPPGAANSAAYMEIKNVGSGNRTLTAVSSPICRAAELHRSSHKGGLMRMEMVDSVEIKGGESVRLKPMGLHLMLIGLKSSLKRGGEAPLNLTFRDGTTVTVNARVGKGTP